MNPRGSASVLLSLAVFFCAAPALALSEPCGVPALTTNGVVFADYEDIEYSSEGYLIYHFRFSPTTAANGALFQLERVFFDDSCNATSNSFQPGPHISFPPGVTDWSVHVSSTTLTVWDDQNDAEIFEYEIPEYPPYTRLMLRGHVGGNSFLSFESQRVPIMEGAEAPVFENTAVKAEACPDFALAEVFGLPFDDYERAEYVDGLLRVHLRFKSLAAGTRDFPANILTIGEDCIVGNPTSAGVDVRFPNILRYYSFRMISPTEWQLWDDDREQPMHCTGCSGTISEGTPFVAFYARYNGNFGPMAMRTTPFSPTVENSCTEDCFSNVLFIPGLKGSVLKLGSDTLWPPTIWSDDIPQLSLDVNGASLNDVRVDGVVDEFCVALICTPIYEPFTGFLDELADEGTIADWEALPYDWRYLPSAVLEGIHTTESIVDPIEVIESLAAESKSGKVAIVAHSMGGLVGKALIKQLEDEGKGHLVDSFVMVGSPQIGTPQAASAILHGDGESLAPGFIVRADVARELAQNMTGAYSLLPSPRYFDVAADPVISFDSETSFTTSWISAWGSFLNLHPEFFDFTTGQGVERQNPPSDLLRVPEILNTLLMTRATNFHTEHDDYLFPEHVRVVQVAGWGLPTVKNIEYRESHDLPSYRTTFTTEGDKTVVYPSAIASDTDETLFFNLYSFRDENDNQVQHRDLLNALPIQSLIENVIRRLDVQNTSYLTVDKPTVANLDDRLLISTYSPVVLGVTDEFGNFTGIHPSQDLSDEILSVRQEIPHSSFIYTSESQHIFVPKTGNYTFAYKGIGTGPTTVEIENFSHNNATRIAEYSDIPTMKGTFAMFDVVSETLDAIVLRIDAEGDGTIDTIVYPDDFSLEEYLSAIRNLIMALEASNKTQLQLLKELEKLEKHILINNPKNQQPTMNALQSLYKTIFNISSKGKISDADAQMLISIIGQIELVI